MGAEESFSAATCGEPRRGRDREAVLGDRAAARGEGGGDRLRREGHAVLGGEGAGRELEGGARGRADDPAGDGDGARHRARRRVVGEGLVLLLRAPHGEEGEQPKGESRSLHALWRWKGGRSAPTATAGSGSQGSWGREGVSDGAGALCNRMR